MRLFNLVVLWLVCITSAQAQISVIPTVTHLTSTSTPSAGAISLAVSGGVSPYSYTWTPGNLYTQNITNQTANTYVVKIKDSGIPPITSTYTYSIGYKVAWAEDYGTVSKHDTLQNNGTYGWAQAISRNTLLGSTDGWFEYVLKDLNQYKQLGFLDSTSLLKGNNLDIDYGFYYDGVAQKLYRIVNGTTALLVNNPSAGTVLRAQRVGNVVSLIVNGVTSYSVTNATDAAKQWKLKALLHTTNNGSLINVGCSFLNQSNLVFPGYGGVGAIVTHLINPFGNDGSAKVTPVLPGTYTYTWQPGSVVSPSITLKPMGSYTLTMEDSLNNQRKLVYALGHKTRWEQFHSTQQKHDTLVNIGPNGWGQAISKNMIPGSTDGWFEYVLRDISKVRPMGFLDSVSATQGNAADIDYGFYYEGANQRLHRIVNGVNTLVGHPAEGAILRVERIGSTINFKVNGAVVYSTVNASAAAKNWYVKALVYTGSSVINMGMSTSACTLTANAGTLYNITCASPTISLSGSSNTTGVSYSWTPGGSSPTSSVTSVTSPGIYTLQVTDPSNGCIITATTTVTQDFCIEPVVTNYQNDTLRGSIDLNVTGPDGPYNIAWDSVYIQSSAAVYDSIKTSMPGIIIDSLSFTHYLDSIKLLTVKSGLLPGFYTFQVYDAMSNNIANAGYVVGSKPAFMLDTGLVISTCTIPPFTFFDGTRRYFGSGVCLSQAGSYSPGYHYMVLGNSFEPASESYLRFTVPNTTDILYVGLHDKKAGVDGTYNDMMNRALFKFNGNGTYDVIFDSTVIYSGTNYANDNFAMRMDPDSGKLRFYYNEALVASGNFANLSGATELWPKAILGSTGGLIKNILVLGPVIIGPIKIPKFDGVNGTIGDVNCDNNCSGSINASGWFLEYNTPRYYEIYDQANTLLSTIQANGASNVTFTGLCAGTYKVVYYAFTYQTFHVFPFVLILPVAASTYGTFEVNYAPNWMHVVNSSVNPTNFSLRKIAGAQNVDDAGAASNNVLSANTAGWLEWSAATTYGSYIIGLSHTDANLLGSSVNYGIALTTMQLIGTARFGFPVINGVAQFSNWIQYNGTDKFRLQTTGTGSNLVFKINNQVHSQFTTFNPGQTYLVDATLSVLNGDINKPRVSFGCEGSVVYAVPKEKPDGTFYKTYSKKLYLKYDEKYIDETLKFTVYDMGHNVINTSSLSIPKQYGNNWLSLDFSAISSMPNNKYYILEVFNEKGYKEYVRFFMN